MRAVRWLVSVALLAAPRVAATQRDTSAALRGVVLDSIGRPVVGAEVYAATVGRGARTSADGRFTMRHLVAGPTRLIVRLPGSRPVDSTVLVETGRVLDLRFVLRRLPQSLDTVRIVSHDDCPALTLEGFECRRRAGIGVFRNRAEIEAAKPVYWADMLDGVSHLRRRLVPPSVPDSGGDIRFESTTGWRCLKELYDGDTTTKTYRPGYRSMRPADIVAVEFYDAFDKVPVWYRRYAFDASQPGTRARGLRGRGSEPAQPSRPGQPCALIAYWTRFATRADPKLDQGKNVKRPRPSRGGE